MTELDSMIERLKSLAAGRGFNSISEYSVWRKKNDHKNDYPELEDAFTTARRKVNQSLEFGLARKGEVKTLVQKDPILRKILEDKLETTNLDALERGARRLFRKERAFLVVRDKSTGSAIGYNYRTPALMESRSSARTKKSTVYLDPEYRAFGLGKRLSAVGSRAVIASADAIKARRLFMEVATITGAGRALITSGTMKYSKVPDTLITYQKKIELPGSSRNFREAHRQKVFQARPDEEAIALDWTKKAGPARRRARTVRSRKR